METVIDYEFSRNVHTLDGPRSAIPHIFPEGLPESILDVGCGNGTWLRAALDLGVGDIQGMDGVNLDEGRLLFPKRFFQQQDLSMPWNLGRRFGAALCLEVGEHLDASSAVTLVDTVTAHSDHVCFSAACPGQPGQHHVNCQWPDYWQSLFNSRGYVCSDEARWKIWDDTRVEPWYRQNLFIARRNPAEAGREDRIQRVIHPDMLPFLKISFWPAHTKDLEDGILPSGWYLRLPFKAAASKLRRYVGGR